MIEGLIDCVACIEGVERLHTIGQPLTCGLRKAADQFPGRSGGVVAGDGTVDAIAEGAKFKQRFVFERNRFFDPLHQRAAGQITHAGAIQTIRNDAILFCSG